MAMPSSLSLIVLGVLASSSLTTRISFFSNGQCQNFQYDVQGPNGYPDGDCSLLESKGNFSSFKVVRLDRGCDVTLYGPDKSQGICSPGGSLVADPGRCYNLNATSWAYYSIDTCIRQEQESSETSSSASSSTISTPSSSRSTPTSTTSAADTPQSSDSSANNAAPASNETNTGAIAGGVVGGIAGLALIVGGIWFLFRRRSKQPRDGLVQLNEMSGEPMVEMSGKEVPKPSELPEGRPEAYVDPPPQELSADAERGVKGEKPPS